MLTTSISNYLFKSSNICTHLPVTGFSMYPTLKPRDSIQIRKKTIRLYPGKIYIFLSRGRLICHRLVWHTKENALFCGDNMSRTERIPIHHIIGEYVADESIFLSAIVTMCNIIAVLTQKKVFYQIKREILNRSIAFEKKIRKTRYY